MKFKRICATCKKEFDVRISLFKYIKEYKTFRSSYWFCSEKCHTIFKTNWDNMNRNIDYGLLQIRKELNENAIKQMESN